MGHSDAKQVPKDLHGDLDPIYAHLKVLEDKDATPAAKMNASTSLGKLCRNLAANIQK